MRVAVLGMGRMGKSVAVRLLDGNHEVVVWNRTAGRAGEALKAGAAEASSPAEAAEGTEAVLVSLANDDAVLNVVLGDDGVGPHLGGAVLVDLSTVAPTTSRRLREGVAPAEMVAAPILGGPTAVRSGAATYLVAGDDKVIERLQPVFAALSEKRKHIGADVGAATTAKLLSNYLLMSSIATMAEAVATGQALGMGNDLLRELFGPNPTVSPAQAQRLDDLLEGDHQGWFAARLGAKDVRLARQLAEEGGLSLPVAAVIEGRYDALDGLGLGDADIAAVIELLRR